MALEVDGAEGAAMTAVKNRLAKGKRIERVARQALEAQGHLVESAPNVVRWVPITERPYVPGWTKGAVPLLRPISIRHDFFGAWDAVSIPGDGLQTIWWQITVWEHASDKRKWLQDSSWKNWAQGRILAYVGGSKNRHFRVLRGEDGYEWKGETLMVAK